MSESKIVQIEQNHDNAVLLLAAAEELELDPSVVATTSDGVFNVPQEVAKKAGLKAVEDDADDEAVAYPVDPEAHKKEALVAEAERRGLDSSGTKADIAERLNSKEE